MEDPHLGIIKPSSGDLTPNSPHLGIRPRRWLFSYLGICGFALGFPLSWGLDLNFLSFGDHAFCHMLPAVRTVLHEHHALNQAAELQQPVPGLLGGAQLHAPGDSSCTCHFNAGPGAHADTYACALHHAGAHRVHAHARDFLLKARNRAWKRGDFKPKTHACMQGVTSLPNSISSRSSGAHSHLTVNVHCLICHSVAAKSCMQ